MKSFESFLAPKLEEYLSFRSSLGYTNKVQKYAFFTFDQYLIENQIDNCNILQPSFFLVFRKKLKQNHKTINRIFTTLSGLFQFLVRQDYCSQNPLQDIPPLPEKGFVPFVFSPRQVDLFLDAISKRIRKTPQYFLLDMSVYLSVVLLARCGMRISEPLRLLRSHYRPEEGTLYIENTKFKKDRLIPIPKAVLVEIDNYLTARNTFVPFDQNPYLFPGKKHKALKRDQICPVFEQAIREIDLNRPRQVLGNITFGPPTPHSLRHSFVINTLKNIKDRGESPQHALPVMAAYIGHAKYQYTGAYLKVSDSKDVQGLIELSKTLLHLS